MTNQTWNTQLYDQKHSFVTNYGQDLITLLEPQVDEHILDLGCGTGHLTKVIANAGAKTLGIDSSPTMIKKAQESYPELEFEVADARDFCSTVQYDAVFSNAALHWIKEADQVATTIAKALRPGGRLVAELGGKHNLAGFIGAAQKVLNARGIKGQHHWYFPSLAQYTGLLEQAGLEVHYAIWFARPTKLEDGKNGLRNWFKMFGSDLLQNVSVELEDEIFSDIEGELKAQQFQEGSWFADYQRLRLVAVKMLP